MAPGSSTLADAAQSPDGFSSDEKADEVVYFVTIGYRLTNVLTYLGMIAAGTCAVFGWFPNGLTIRDMNEKYRTILTPDIFAYYIWLLIFALQAIAILDLLLFTKFRAQHGRKGKLLHAVDHYWIIGFGCIAGWTIAASYETSTGMWVSFGFSVGALASFLISLLRLHGFTGWFRLWYYVLYVVSAGLTTGWLSVEVANSTLVVLKRYDISETVEAAIGFAILAVATVAGLAMLFMSREFAFCLALAWGLVGVLVQHVRADGDSQVDTDDYTVAVICSIVLAGILVLGCALRLIMIFVWDVPRALKRRNDYQDVASSADAADAAERGTTGGSSARASMSVDGDADAGAHKRKGSGAWSKP